MIAGPPGRWGLLRRDQRRRAPLAPGAVRPRHLRRTLLDALHATQMGSDTDSVFWGCAALLITILHGIRRGFEGS